jgi:hypothetical protein
MPWEDAAGRDIWHGQNDELPATAEHIQQRCVREGRVQVTYRVGLYGYSHWVNCEVLHGDACEGHGPVNDAL